jgi:hypothetical protein
MIVTDGAGVVRIGSKRATGCVVIAQQAERLALARERPSGFRRRLRSSKIDWAAMSGPVKNECVYG